MGGINSRTRSVYLLTGLPLACKRFPRTLIESTFSPMKDPLQDASLYKRQGFP